MKVNTDIMTSIASNLVTIKNNMNKCEDNLDSINKELFLYWSGDASSEFKTNLDNSISTFKSYSTELNTTSLIISQDLSNFSTMTKNIEKAIDDM